MHHQGLELAGLGHNVGFNIKNIAVKNFRCEDVAENFVLCSFSSVLLPTAHNLNHPVKIKTGYSPVLDCHITHMTCHFAELKEKLDRRTGMTLEDFPQTLESGDAATVKMIPNRTP